MTWQALCSTVAGRSSTVARGHHVIDPHRDHRGTGAPTRRGTRTRTTPLRHRARFRPKRRAYAATADRGGRVHLFRQRVPRKGPPTRARTKRPPPPGRRGPSTPDIPKSSAGCLVKSGRTGRSHDQATSAHSRRRTPWPIRSLSESTNIRPSLQSHGRAGSGSASASLTLVSVTARPGSAGVPIEAPAGVFEGADEDAETLLARAKAIAMTVVQGRSLEITSVHSN